MIEPAGPVSPPPGPAGKPRRRGPAATVALAVIAALCGGAVASGVTLGVLHYQSQNLNIGTHVTVTEESVATQVADRASPAVVSVVTADSAGSYSAGSGFLVNSNGFVVTNVQVIANASLLSVLLPGDSKRHDARVLDFDCQSQLALLKVDGVSGLPTLSFADPGALRLGQTVIALGGPMSPRYSMAKGIVTALHRNLTLQDPVDAHLERQLSNTIQTDAGIDSGNSGGPLLNVAGQVSGISLIAVSAGQRLGFALSTGGLQPEVDQILRTGQLTVAALGLQGVDLTADQAALRNLPAGAFLRSVTAGGPADKAGLKAGDVVTQIDDLKLDDSHPLGEVLRTRFAPTQRVAVTVFHAGTLKQVPLTLVGEHPSCQ